jgi:transposase
MARKRVLNIPHPELSDEQWEYLDILLPQPEASPHGGPKPIPNRPVVEGILWVLRNGGRWKALPEGYPSPATCWRRLAQWEEQGVWLEVWHAFLDTLHEQQRLDWDECFADGSFASAKKGATASGKPSAARVRSGWWWSMVKAFRWHATSTRPTGRRLRS